MKKIILISLLSIAAIANADPYVDLSIGADTGSNSFAINADGGYMFSRYVGLEGGITGTTNYTLVDGAVKGVLPLGSVVDLYGKLGLGINSYSSGWSGNNSTFGLLYGAGVGFNIARNWQLHVEDYSVTGPNPNFLMFGGQFNF